jgi:hypothetical protein
VTAELVEALRLELSYAKDRLSRARAAYHRDPVSERAMRWLDNAEADVELWRERMEKAEAEADEIRAAHSAHSTPAAGRGN